jgi:HrpA-like RNA helicase
MIGITEPRRVAAVSMAKRVAYEMNLPGPDEEVRHKHQNSHSPAILIKLLF